MHGGLSDGTRLKTFTTCRTNMAKTPKHKDIVGREINVGDVVVVPQWKTVAIGVVLKINPKMITVNVLPMVTTNQLSTHNGRWVSHYMVTKGYTHTEY